MATRVLIDDSAARAKLQQILEISQRPRAVLAAMGREARNLLLSHFRAKDSAEPSVLGQLGGRRSHFWAAVGRSVASPEISADDRGVSLNIADPRIGQKVFGGRIVAKRGQWLTIPVSPDAYARRASTFEAETGRPLFRVNTAGEPVLASRVGGRAGGLQVEYLLRRSVDQPPDADALPELGESSDFVTALVTRADRVLQRQLNNQGGET